MALYAVMYENGAADMALYAEMYENGAAYWCASHRQSQLKRTLVQCVLYKLVTGHTVECYDSSACS